MDTCTGVKAIYKGDVAMSYHCALPAKHPPPCQWEPDEAPAPQPRGSGTYPALPRSAATSPPSGRSR